MISLRANGTISAVFRCRGSSTSFGRCLPWLSEMGASCAPCTRIVVLWTRRAWRRVWFRDHTVRLGRHVRHLLQHRGARCRTARTQRSAVLFVARPTVWSTERTRKAIDATAGVCLTALLYLALVLGTSASRFIANAGMFISGLASVVVIVAAIRGRNRGDDSLLCSPTLARNSVLQPLPVPLANNRAGHQTEFGAHQTVADVVSARTHARCDSVVLLARPGAASEVAIRQTKGPRHRVMNHSRYR